MISGPMPSPANVKIVAILILVGKWGSKLLFMVLLVIVLLAGLYSLLKNDFLGNERRKKSESIVDS